MQWKTWIDRIKHSPLQALLTTAYTAITVIALLVLSLSLFFRYNDFIYQRVGEDSIRLINQINYGLDSYLRSIMRVSDTVYYSVVKNADLETDSISAEVNLLYEAHHDQIISIVVFDRSGRLVTSVPQSTLKPTATPWLEDWYLNALSRIENFHFSAPHVQNLFADPGEQYHWVISMSRAVELTHGGRTGQGVLLIDLDFSSIEQVCRGSDRSDSGYVYLIDENGQILYHPNQELIHSGLAVENNQRAALYDEGNHYEEFNGEDRLVTVKTVSYTGWKLVGVTPVDAVNAGVFPNMMFLFFLVLLIIMLLIFVNTILSSRITVPLRKLEQSVGRLEAGDLGTKIAVGGSYEVRHLGMAVQDMVVQMQRLMDDIVHEQEAKRRGELEVLQAQINPHFLYNTLDSIVWMIENEQYDEAIRMVTALARLFRISLSKGRRIITLGSELQHASSYLTIQKMRYKNKFVAEMQTDPALVGYACPKLVIQPLIENAIYHAMDYMDGDGRIIIRTKLVGEELHIEVEDNGPGIPPKILETLLTPDYEKQHPLSGPRDRKGYGMRNVHERVRLYYGEPYGVEIESRPDEGTLVRIRLPARPYAREKEDTP